MTLTQAGGFGRVPLAQLSAMADVSALQDEAGMAAVVENGSFHRWPGRPRRHPAVLQRRPHPRAQQHCEAQGHRVTTGTSTSARRAFVVRLQHRRSADFRSEAVCHLLTEMLKT